jgi:hypothetical protein
MTGIIGPVAELVRRAAAVEREIESSAAAADSCRAGSLVRASVQLVSNLAAGNKDSAALGWGPELLRVLGAVPTSPEVAGVM